MKPIIGRKYIVTKIIQNVTKSQVVTIDYIYKDNIDVLYTLLLIANRINKTTQPLMLTNECEINKHHNLYLPNELLNIICKMAYIPSSYCYNYGYFSFHEGYCRHDEIRELTAEEKKLCENGTFSFKLPNQFYHSAPSF